MAICEPTVITEVQQLVNTLWATKKNVSNVTSVCHLQSQYLFIGYEFLIYVWLKNNPWTVTREYIKHSTLPWLNNIKKVIKILSSNKKMPVWLFITPQLGQVDNCQSSYSSSLWVRVENWQSGYITLQLGRVKNHQISCCFTSHLDHVEKCNLVVSLHS